MSDFSIARAEALDGPAWLRARRASAAARFASLPLPTADDELWRYTPIKQFDLGAYGLWRAERPDDGQVVHNPFVDAVADRAAFVVIADGRLATAEVAEDVTELGVTVAVADAERRLLEVPERNAFDELHDAFVNDVVVVTVPAGVVVERPVVVLQVATGGGVASFPHLVVDAGEQSEVTVLDVWVSSAGPAYVSPVVEIQSAAAANVRYVGVQGFGNDAWAGAHLLIAPGREATTKAWFAALGGRYARLSIEAQLEAKASAVDLAGVYFGEDEQVHDFRSVQDHKATRSVSNLLLKGAVVDRAHAIYTGMIKVHEGAKATESFLANRNLVLSDGAHVDSVPNLEIVNENDIKSCGHAAATGPVDEEHVFYLESRGVPTEVAQRLIVFGFFDDVIRNIPVAGVRDPLRAAITRKLEKAGPGEVAQDDA
ncbi:MAG TPA: SufD family Fe-S cluster assembly protein [Acidimicrobiales bacterium]|nr:SufD family Fe-S cluster assembly protein [Acidimicrobiales bacterium]